MVGTIIMVGDGDIIAHAGVGDIHLYTLMDGDIQLMAMLMDMEMLMDGVTHIMVGDITMAITMDTIMAIMMVTMQA